MSMTGIAVSDEAVNTYNKVKSGNLDFAFFHIDKKKNSVETDEDNIFPKTEEDVAAFTADKKTRHENFKTRVWPKFEAAIQQFAGKGALPRYVVLDFSFEHEDGRKISKLIYINWCPDNCPVRQKMLAAGTAQTVTGKFDGLNKKLEATTLADIDYDYLLEVCLK